MIKRICFILFLIISQNILAKSINWNELGNSLQPFDILFEKTTFRITDRFIPGHFGHVFIYLGKRKDLCSNSQLSKSIDENTTDSLIFVEANLGGVRLTNIEQYLNADDLLVLRTPKFFLSTNKKVELIDFISKQLGKPYDFLFDVHSNDKLICTELIYNCFDNLNWQTKSYLGKETLCPDDVAKTLLLNSFSIIKFYHNCKLVNQIKTENKLYKLLTKPRFDLFNLHLFYSEIKENYRNFQWIK